MRWHFLQRLKFFTGVLFWFLSLLRINLPIKEAYSDPPKPQNLSHQHHTKKQTILYLFTLSFFSLTLQLCFFNLLHHTRSIVFFFLLFVKSSRPVSLLSSSCFFFFFFFVVSEVGCFRYFTKRGEGGVRGGGSFPTIGDRIKSHFNSFQVLDYYVSRNRINRGPETPCHLCGVVILLTDFSPLP